MSKAYKKRTGGAPPAPSTGLPFTGQIIVYSVNDDGFYQKGYTLTRPIVKGAVGNTRYIDNGDGTITDNATGLMWVQDAAGAGGNFGVPLTWQDALDFCWTLDFGGHADDWRLPNIKELISITDYGLVNKAIDPIFLNILANYYWSSTTYKDIDAYAWFSYFYAGDIMYDDKMMEKYVLPVRLGLP